MAKRSTQSIRRNSASILVCILVILAANPVSGRTLVLAGEASHGVEVQGPGLAAYQVKDLRASPAMEAGSYPTSFATMGGILYFVATSPTTGEELWRTDGTPDGSYLLSLYFAV